MSEGLVLEGVSISHGTRRIVGVDCRVGAGEIVTLMGPSGSGKSTLLAFLTGTLPPVFTARGRVLLGGHDVTALPPAARGIGILFQDALLFPHLSVGENLAFGLKRGGSRAARRARVEAALRDVGLDGFADRDPATLSGGQKARAALMRTLLAEPSALLLDEAFSSLDAARRDQVRGLVFARAVAQRLPVLMVTHDPGDAAAADGPVICLDGPPPERL